MKKKIIFFILFATMFVISGCGLTEKDKLDIADGIGQVHVDGSPDTWTSENGIPILIKHEGFGKRADGTYCMTASVMVDKEQYMPPTPLCNIGGEWKTVSKAEKVPDKALVQKKIVTPVVLFQKTEKVPVKKQAAVVLVKPIHHMEQKRNKPNKTQRSIVLE